MISWVCLWKPDTPRSSAGRRRPPACRRCSHGCRFANRYLWNCELLYVHIYIYICIHTSVCICICIYVYIYIYVERERCIHRYRCIYIYREREQEIHRLSWFGLVWLGSVNSSSSQRRWPGSLDRVVLHIYIYILCYWFMFFI